MSELKTDWKSCVIAKDGQTSAECDLGRPYRIIIIEVPTIDTATLVVQTARVSGGTFRDLYVTDPADGGNNKVIAASGEGGFIWSINVGAIQYIKLYASAAQSTAARTFYIKGAD